MQKNVDVGFFVMLIYRSAWFIAILRMAKNVSFYLILDYILENYLSNIVERIDNIIEILYNYDSKCH